MRLFEISNQALPHIPELKAISKKIHDLMIEKESGDDEYEEWKLEELKKLDAKALALGYEVDMDAAEYPFTDVQWIHIETGTPVEFTSEQFTSTQH